MHPSCVAVVREYRPAAPAKTTPDAAQQFLGDWAFASAPIEPIAEARQRAASRAG